MYIVGAKVSPRLVWRLLDLFVHLFYVFVRVGRFGENVRVGFQYVCRYGCLSILQVRGRCECAVHLFFLLGLFYYLFAMLLGVVVRAGLGHIPNREFGPIFYCFLGFSSSHVHRYGGNSVNSFWCLFVFCFGSSSSLIIPAYGSGGSKYGYVVEVVSFGVLVCFCSYGVRVASSVPHFFFRVYFGFFRQERFFCFFPSIFFLFSGFLARDYSRLLQVFCLVVSREGYTCHPIHYRSGSVSIGGLSSYHFSFSFSLVGVFHRLLVVYDVGGRRVGGSSRGDQGRGGYTRGGGCYFFSIVYFVFRGGWLQRERFCGMLYLFQDCSYLPIYCGAWSVLSSITRLSGSNLWFSSACRPSSLLWSSM